MSKKNIVIAGGGTGGHVYPGLALAETLKSKDPNIQVHFVGARGGLEEQIVPRYGYPLHLLNVGRLHSSVGVWQRLKTLVALPLSLIHSFFLYWKLRPQWVLGIGGFASGPIVLIASLCGGKTAILEPNAYPGMANRWLSKVVGTCFVVFKETASFFPAKKVRVVGLPVRLQKKTPSLEYNGQRPFRILVFGGSQGARAVNEVVGAWVENLGDEKSSLEILHQIGRRDFPVWKERYGNKHQKFLDYREYIDDMPEKLEWADFIICRSGVGSVVEVAMAGKPALFIPLPTAADNHQVKNAEVLANSHAALMIEQKNLNEKVLGEVISQLKNEPARLEKMMVNLKEFDYSRAQEEILQHLTRESI